MRTFTRHDIEKQKLYRTIKKLNNIQSKKQIKIEELERQLKELESINKEHDALLLHISKCFDKNKGEHNYFDTITRVSKQLKEAEEVIDFYADEDSWNICNEYYEKTTYEAIAGKKAIEYKKKWSK